MPEQVIHLPAFFVGFLFVLFIVFLLPDERESRIHVSYQPKGNASLGLGSG